MDPKSKIVWMLLPECPNEFLDKLAATKDEDEFVGALIEGHKKSWIQILGTTDKSTRDLAACLQEFYSVKVISDEPRYGGGDVSE